MPSLCHHTINQPALNCQFSPLQITAHFLHFSPLLILLRKATPHTHTGTWSNYTLIGQPFALRRQHTFARVPSQGLFPLDFFFAYSTQERHLLDFRSHITTPAGRRRRAAFSLQQEEKIQTNYTSYFLNQNISISSINTFYIFFAALSHTHLDTEKSTAHTVVVVDVLRWLLVERTDEPGGGAAHCCWSMETLDLLRASTLTNPPVILFEHSQKLRVHLYTSFLQVTLISDKFLALKGRKKTHNEQ